MKKSSKYLLSHSIFDLNVQHLNKKNANKSSKYFFTIFLRLDGKDKMDLFKIFCCSSDLWHELDRKEIFSKIEVDNLSYEQVGPNSSYFVI